MSSEVQANVVEVFCVSSTGLKPEYQRLEVQNLPGEVVKYIFNKLCLRDLCSAVLVSRLWRNIGQDPSLWKYWAVRLRSCDVATVRSVIMGTRFLLTSLVRISDNFWSKLSPCQIEDLVKEILKKKNVKKIVLSLQRDVLESPNPDKSRTLVGDLPQNIEVAETDMKILEIRPVRVGRSITYKYRVQYNFILNIR